MKTSSIKLTPIVAGIAALSLSLSPMVYAQTADQTSNTKALNTVDSPNNNSSTTGSPSSQPGTLDKNNSKDGVSTADKDPSMAPTDSANASATKEPTTGNATTDSDKMAKSSSDSSEPKAMSDEKFIETAAQGGMTEVELGKLAAENASSSDVKEFGSKMVTDHSKANADLKSIADKEGVAVPTALDAKHQMMVTKFEHMSGPAFDKAYVHMMVKDHEKTASVFRMESDSGKNPDLKAFAGDTLKTIEMHLSDIKSIQSSMK